MKLQTMAAVAVALAAVGRWHYSANGSKGGWSATGKFVPGT
jgi:hypothetical protein